MSDPNSKLNELLRLRGSAGPAPAGKGPFPVRSGYNPSWPFEGWFACGRCSLGRSLRDNDTLGPASERTPKLAPFIDVYLEALARFVGIEAELVIGRVGSAASSRS